MSDQVFKIFAERNRRREEQARQLDRDVGYLIPVEWGQLPMPRIRAQMDFRPTIGGVLVGPATRQSRRNYSA